MAFSAATLSTATPFTTDPISKNNLFRRSFLRPWRFSRFAFSPNFSSLSSTIHARPDYFPNRINDSDYVRVLDTTLRDAANYPGAYMTSNGKLVVARQLARLGVDIIEAGYPAFSPSYLDAVRSIAIEVGNQPVGEQEHVPVICALARCQRKDIDAAWEAVRHARRPRVHIFIFTSKIHMKHEPQSTREEIVRIARDMVAYARSLGCDDVQFSAEDASRCYSLSVC